MATKQSTVDYLLEQINSAGPVSVKKMFGEYALYFNTKIVGLVCDDQLYLKPTKAGQKLIGKTIEAPPYKGAKPHFLIEADSWENEEWMVKLLRATEQELPQPKPKPKKKPK